MESPDEHAQPVIPERCASCGAKLKGKFCHKCGEKKIVPERDFSFLKFLNQTMWHFVRFDSKLLRCGWLLFSKPGFLTAEWIAGRRIGYMKPLQLFVLASVLFYFFLPTTTAYFTGDQDLARGYRTQNYLMNTFHFDFQQVLSEKALTHQVDEETLKTKILAQAAKQSKTWLVLLIPFWGALIYLFFKQKLPWLAPHLIFAMHGLTFYILFDLSLHAVFYVSGFADMGKHILLLLMVTFPVYQALAAHRVYGNSWPLTILKTGVVAAGFVVLLLLYRQIITIEAITFF